LRAVNLLKYGIGKHGLCTLRPLAEELRAHVGQHPHDVAGVVSRLEAEIVDREIEEAALQAAESDD